MSQQSFEELKFAIDRELVVQSGKGLRRCEMDWPLPLKPRLHDALIKEFERRGFKITVREMLGGFGVTITW